jgi:phosphoglycerate dehydrogenase-like enzyme
MSPSSGPIVGVFCAEPGEILEVLRRELPDDIPILVCDRHDGIDEIIDDVDVLLAYKFGREYPFPRDRILEAPRLQWVQLDAAGADHIAPYAGSDVIVTRASGIHGEIMAQYVIATLVHRLWDFPRLLRQQSEHVWEKYEVPTLVGRTMGVVGVGQVGSTIGARARDLGMRLLGVRRSGEPVEGFEEIVPTDRMKEVLRRSDVVVVCLPLTPETRHVIGVEEQQAMRPDTIFVNVSRGGVVDDAALLEHLKQGGLGAAILDVFEEEPLPATSGFWDLPEVLVTPHISSEVAGWELSVVSRFLDNFIRWREGRALRDVVDPELGY